MGKLKMKAKLEGGGDSDESVTLPNFSAGEGGAHPIDIKRSATDNQSELIGGEESDRGTEFWSKLFVRSLFIYLFIFVEVTMQYWNV